MNLTCITDVSNRPIDWYYNPSSSNDRSTDVTIFAFNKMHLKWNKNNIKVTNGDSSYVLTISNITKTDEGIYICFDHASFGERSYTNVTVLGKFFHNVITDSKHLNYYEICLTIELIYLFRPKIL